MIRRSAVTVSTSNADNAAFRALNDVAVVTAEIHDTRVIGGQMVGLLLTAFPADRAILRRTADADAAISAEVASSGVIHEALVDSGYSPANGNRYLSSDGRIVDLVVPSDNSFRQVQLGGRGFDAAPGLPLVLAGNPIVLDVDVTLTDRSRLEFSVKVPTVELALVLKALTLRSRAEAKDLVDIYNLLQIGYSWEAALIGGWKLAEPGLPGARGDAQSELHRLAATANRNQELALSEVPQELFVALIKAKVGEPRAPRQALVRST